MVRHGPSVADPIAGGFQSISNLFFTNSLPLLRCDLLVCRTFSDLLVNLGIIPKEKYTLYKTLIFMVFGGSNRLPYAHVGMGCRRASSTIPIHHWIPT